MKMPSFLAPNEPMNYEKHLQNTIGKRTAIPKHRDGISKMDEEPYKGIYARTPKGVAFIYSDAILYRQ